MARNCRVPFNLICENLMEYYSTRMMSDTSRKSWAKLTATVLYTFATDRALEWVSHTGLDEYTGCMVVMWYKELSSRVMSLSRKHQFCLSLCYYHKWYLRSLAYHNDICTHFLIIMTLPLTCLWGLSKLTDMQSNMSQVRECLIPHNSAYVCQDQTSLSYPLFLGSMRLKLTSSYCMASKVWRAAQVNQTSVPQFNLFLFLGAYWK